MMTTWTHIPQPYNMHTLPVNLNSSLPVNKASQFVKLSLPLSVLLQHIHLLYANSVYPDQIQQTRG